MVVGLYFGFDSERVFASLDHVQRDHDRFLLHHRGGFFATSAGRVFKHGCKCKPCSSSTADAAAARFASPAAATAAPTPTPTPRTLQESRVVDDSRTTAPGNVHVGAPPALETILWHHRKHKVRGCRELAGRVLRRDLSPPPHCCECECECEYANSFPPRGSRTTTLFGDFGGMQQGL